MKFAKHVACSSLRTPCSCSAGAGVALDELKDGIEMASMVDLVDCVVNSDSTVSLSFPIAYGEERLAAAIRSQTVLPAEHRTRRVVL